MNLTQVFIILLYFCAFYVISAESESDIDKKFKDLFKNNPFDDKEYDYEDDVSESGDYENGIKSGINNNTSSVNKTVSSENTTQSIKEVSEYENIINSYNAVSKNIIPIEHMIKHKFYEFIYSLDLPDDCLASYARIISAMKSGELWAFKFLDSSGKIPSGVTEGVSSFFGDYDQCLNIQSTHSDSNSHLFQGKYCLASPQLAFPSFEVLHSNITIKFLNNKTNLLLNKVVKRKMNTIKLFMANNFYITKFTFFRYGFCIPSNCEAKHIQNAINKVLQPIIKIPVEVGPECDVKSTESKYNQTQTFAIFVFSFMIIMAAISTTLELIIKRRAKQHIDKNQVQKMNKCENILTLFSIIKSTKSLFATKKVDYQCIHTLTFIFLIWIHWGRYYVAPLTINLIGVKNIFSSFILQMISEKKYFWVRTPFPLGTLFIFSGIFISLDFFGKKHKISPSGYVNFVLIKWLRFNIRCIGPILVIFILSSLGSGPIWHLGQNLYAKSCENYYWHNLLFINPYVGVKQLCNPSSIYYSIIFQLQIISPIILIPLYYSPIIGIILNVIAILIGCVACILPQFFGLPIAPFEVSDMTSIDQIQRSLVRYNVGPEQCITPFVTGLLIGYLIIHRSKFLSKTMVSVSLWILFIVLSSSAIIWGENFKDLDVIPNKIDLMLWFSLGKILWASGCGALILVLCAGKGTIYRFLSMDVFRPITRLNFTFLLLHTILMYYRFFVTKENVEITHYYMLQCILLDTFFTYVIAFILYILIEHPFYNLIKLCQFNSDSANDVDIIHNNHYELKPLNNNLSETNESEIKFTFPVGL